MCLSPSSGKVVSTPLIRWDCSFTSYMNLLCRQGRMRPIAPVQTDWPGQIGTGLMPNQWRLAFFS
jgi:hypothetical protein